MNTEDLFGEVISSYSRRQAIEDGVLADLSALAPEVCAQHFRHPVACSAGVWALIEKAIGSRTACNDLNGVVHDILWMSKAMGRRVAGDEQTRVFPVIITGGRKRNHTLKIHCGPGDNSEPVLTVMLLGED